MTLYVWKLYRNPCGMRANLSAVGAAVSLFWPSESPGFVSVQRNHFSELAAPVWLCSGDVAKFNFGSSCKFWVWGCLEQLMGLEQLKPVAYGWHPTLVLTNDRNLEVKTEANNEDKRHHHSCGAAPKRAGVLPLVSDPAVQRFISLFLNPDVGEDNAP